MGREEPPRKSGPLEHELREALQRVLACRGLAECAQLRKFLAFIVEESLRGRACELKEYRVGVEVFRKSPTFDPRLDPIVRVQAGRLRARMAHYYRGEGSADPVVIELPKGSYAATFHYRSDAGQSRSAVAPPGRMGVAVMPFVDLSKEGDQGHLCYGVRDELIRVLTRIRPLRVIAWKRGSEETGHRWDARAVGAEVEAAYVVEGSVLKSEEHLRISTYLIEAATGAYLWSEAFEGINSDLVLFLERISHAVVAALRAQITGAELGSPVRPPTGSVAAYDLYLRGRYHWGQRTEAGLKKAAEFFRRSSNEDPGYALAYSGLADASALLANYGMVPPGEVWETAYEAANSAVLLDSELAEAHTSLAHVKATHDWDWPAAGAGFLRAIELNPRYATAHHWYALTCLAPQGRLDEAREEMRLASMLDPVSWSIARDTAVVDFYCRDYESAVAACEQTLDLSSTFASAYWILGLIHSQMGEAEQAVEYLTEAVRLAPDAARMQAAFGWALVQAGQPARARAVLEELTRLSGTRYVAPFDFFTVYLAMGEKDAALAQFAQACRDRNFELMFVTVDPRFEALAREPAYASQLETISRSPVQRPGRAVQPPRTAGDFQRAPTRMLK